MPKCSSCGTFYDDLGAVELVRNKENRWLPVCRPCLGKGVDVNDVSVPNIAVEEAALRLAEKPNVEIGAVGGNPLEKARKLLDALRALRQASEKVSRIRGHERHSVEMTVSFTLARDDAAHEGVIKDISLGGILMHTSRALVRGQILQFDLKSQAPSAVAAVLQGNAEVRRVTKSEDGGYAVGLRFIKRQAVKGANRRRFRRYTCDMQAYYQRRESTLMCLGRVRDISQGGCRMAAAEEFEQNEVFSVRIVGGGGGRGDLLGSMQVCRVIPRESEFEIGCSFLRMRIERPEDLDKGK